MESITDFINRKRAESEPLKKIATEIAKRRESSKRVEKEDPEFYQALTELRIEKQKRKKKSKRAKFSQLRP